MTPTAAKRGYSRAFRPRTERRVKFDVDRIPAALHAKVKAQCRRTGISMRAATLALWSKWIDGEVTIGKGDV